MIHNHEVPGRNKPKDANETVNRLASTPSEVMSNYTKRRLHPDIDDPDLEDTLVQQEEAQRMQNLLDHVFILEGRIAD